MLKLPKESAGAQPNVRQAFVHFAEKSFGARGLPNFLASGAKLALVGGLVDAKTRPNWFLQRRRL
ncbi:hypothetical protein ABTC85_20990, partial [Acinetobacter baumannii]